MTFRVLVTARSFCATDGPHHEYLSKSGCTVDLRPPDHPLGAPELAALIPGYDGVILGLDVCDASVIAAADRLRAFASVGNE